jgi:hypothetical protein
VHGDVRGSLRGDIMAVGGVCLRRIQISIMVLLIIGGVALVALLFWLGIEAYNFIYKR